MASPSKKNKVKLVTNKEGYLYSMSHSVGIDQSSSILNMIPIACFAALVIIMTRYYTYQRPMSQFFWTSQTDTTDLVDFFSYYKMEMVVISAVIALLMIAYRFTTQSFAVKKCYAYIPMLVYSLFVILSYVFSSYKEFALWGWNERFEGTIPLLCYMVMLFLIINSVNTEENIKQIVWPIAISAFLLSILGVSQALDKDFFRTVIGQKMLMPNATIQAADGTTTTIWKQIEATEALFAETGKHYLTFTFNNKEIYQTVYNINYVSFYLTLLVPLFAMLFIRELRDKEAKLWKKIALGVLVALLVFNLIGSASAGGYVGLAIAVMIALVIFNKQLLKWIKPLLIVLVILGIVLSFTTERWLPEIKGAIQGVLGTETTVQLPAGQKGPEKAEAGSKNPAIDYIITKTNTITMSIEGNEIIVAAVIEGNTITGFNVCDKDGNVLTLEAEEGNPIFNIHDDRFYEYARIALAYDGTQYFIQIYTGNYAWNFVCSGGELYFAAGTGRLVKLDKIETIGFKNNPNFGSGRGFIWNHSIPLLKKTLFIGTGADTFCAVFPQNDYAGKWTAYGNNSDANLYLIVDKPHNMYLHAGIGTGVVSLIALLVLFGTYVLQSIKLFWKRDLENDYLLFAGAGTFLGVTAFLVTGLVDDSTVSVMPLFYTMLGMGIAINMIIKRRDAKRTAAN